MKYFFDTEFNEDGKTIELISLAVVAEDGREFYRINFDFREEHANDWVKANVLPHLTPRPYLWARGEERGLWRNHDRIGVELREFVGSDLEPEFWADFGAYDWVALCQLYGPMIALPKGWPMFVRDVQMLRKILGEPKFTVLHQGPNNSEHDALTDARECKARHDVLWAKFQDIVSSAKQYRSL